MKTDDEFNAEDEVDHPNFEYRDIRERATEKAIRVDALEKEVSTLKGECQAQKEKYQKLKSKLKATIWGLYFLSNEESWYLHFSIH